MAILAKSQRKMTSLLLETGAKVNLVIKRTWPNCAYVCRKVEHVRMKLGISKQNVEKEAWFLFTT
jgi:hypothetical protein